MSFPRYPKYKDSGVEWLGEVPEHWGVSFLKHQIKMRYGDALASEIREEGNVEVFGSNGSVGTHCVANTKSPAVIIGRKGSYGKIVWANHGGFVIDTAYAIDVDTTNLNLRWVFFLLQPLELDTLSQDTGIPGLAREKAYEIKIVVPPLPEQTAIATFLDRETAKIDAVIAEYQHLISLLAEKRQAVISHAVTKGLDPNVKLKDSGVEWLGQVPEHWGVNRIKYLSTRISSGKTPLGGSDVYVHEGITFLRSQNVYDEGLRLDDVVFITAEVDEAMAVSRVLPNDILLNITGASIGRSCVVPTEFSSANVNQHVCVIRLKDTHQVPFVGLLFKTITIKNQIDYTQNGAAREGLNFVQIGEMTIPLPPMTEQSIITKFINRETTKLEILTTEAHHAIDLLKERRAAVISAAVTGKIDVRNLVKS